MAVNLNDLFLDGRLASVRTQIQEIVSSEILQALREGKRVIVAPRQSGKSYAEISYALETNTQMVLHNNDSKNRVIDEARRIGKFRAKVNVPNLFYSVSDFLNRRGRSEMIKETTFDEFILLSVERQNELYKFWKALDCPRWNFVFTPSTQNFSPFKKSEYLDSKSEKEEEIYGVDGNSLKSNFKDHFGKDDFYYYVNSKRIKALIATAFLN